VGFFFVSRFVVSRVDAYILADWHPPYDTPTRLRLFDAFVGRMKSAKKLRYANIG
jgi:hypothetical protein